MQEKNNNYKKGDRNMYFLILYTVELEDGNVKDRHAVFHDDGKQSVKAFVDFVNRNEQALLLEYQFQAIINVDFCYVPFKVVSILNQHYKRKPEKLFTNY